MNAVYSSLIPALWLAWLVYWMIAAFDAKTTQRVESSASRASHIVPLMIAGWLLSARAAPGGFLAGRIIEPSTAAYALAVLLVAAGLAFAVWARVCLGRNWSGVVTLKRDHELVRSGPYRFVRHPIYTGLLLALIGSALARDEWRGVLAVAIAWLALWRKLKIEEGWMIEQFGEAYQRYRAEVPALIPNPFGRAGARGA